MKLTYRHWTLVGAVVVGAIALVIGYATGAMASAAVFVAIQALALVALLWATRRRVEERYVSHTVAHSAAGNGDVIVYWQPN